MAKFCSRCGWVEENSKGGQEGDCHRLNGSGVRVIIRGIKQALDGSEKVRGVILPAGDGFSFHRIPLGVSLATIKTLYG
jgi:hypothetical protein